LKHHPGGPNALGFSHFYILVSWFEFFGFFLLLKCHAFHYETDPKVKMVVYITSLAYRMFWKNFLQNYFALLRGHHSHGIRLYRIGSISLALPFFGCGRSSLFGK
jgi:hypothetical protein